MISLEPKSEGDKCFSADRRGIIASPIYPNMTGDIKVKMKTTCLLGIALLVAIPTHAITDSQVTPQASQQLSPQPYMYRALAHLDMAKALLRKALKNKGGHKNKASQAIDVAMEELRAGIDYADAKYKAPATK